jgi:hypothetical protein
MLKSPNEIKLEDLNARYGKLQMDAVSLGQQINATLNAADRNTLEQNQQNIYADMEKVYKEIRTLEYQNQQPPSKEDFDFDKSLTKIDFSASREIIDFWFNSLAQEREAALFLLQNSFSMAGDLCLTILRDRLTQEARSFKHIEIDLVLRHSSQDETGLLEVIAESFQPIKLTFNSQNDSLVIIQKILSSLQNGSVIFFEFKKIGKYSGLGVDREKKISSGDKRDNRIQGVMDRSQSLTEKS